MAALLLSCPLQFHWRLSAVWHELMSLMSANVLTVSVDLLTPVCGICSLLCDLFTFMYGICSPPNAGFAHRGVRKLTTACMGICSRVRDLLTAV